MILQQLNPSGRLYAIDRDPDAIQSLAPELEQDPRFQLFHGRFSMLGAIGKRLGINGHLNGILFDLGVSSPQLDAGERGFSFRQSAPLDMRMDYTSGITAAEWINSATESEIRQVLREYGEERFARRIAMTIVERRQHEPILTTTQLAELVSKAMPVHEKDKHPATRTFQAIRIFINQELVEISHALSQALEALADRGRLVVISFHSLEDRMVKRFMRKESRGDEYPPEIPITGNMLAPALKIIGKAIYPDEEEMNKNPRSRSAVLRVAERIRQ